jgi:hypothetical protein
MRQKAYYTAAEIQSDLYTSGKEWQFENGTEYIGLYHKYITGEVYTEPVWNNNTSRKLIKYNDQPESVKTYQSINTSIRTKFKSVYEVYSIPTRQDRFNKSYTRYFIKKINEDNIIEIDELQYNDWSTNKIDKNIYTAVTLTWTIAGNPDDVRVDNVTVPGIITKNKNQVDTASRTLPGITNKLSNLLEHYISSNLTIPPDINE